MAMLAVLFSLGNWQLNRSSEKQALLNAYQQAGQQPEISLDEITQDWQSKKFRRIRLSGSYDADHQVLLENQLHEGKSGFHVLTPFKLHDKDAVVLVNRGWIARSAQLDTIPDIGIAAGIDELVGLLNSPPDVGMRLGSLDQAALGWPKQVPYVDISWLQLQLGQPIEPWVLLLNPDQKAGYLREWTPSVRMTPEKHKGYAFQWFSLAIALIFIFVAMSLKAEGKRCSGTEEMEDHNES
jgi:surfeit locus 1 family protein